jgi:mannose-6-phosphate isomerase-like protein (cupin superfamily)
MTTPLVTEAEQGEAIWWVGALAEIKATAEDTDGWLSIVEVTEGPNHEAPLHVHYREDEGFWILEGSATFYVGDEPPIEAGPGDFVWGPRNIPHRFVTGPEGCRMLFIMTPGGFEKLVREMGEPAESRTLPPDPDGEPDFEMIARVAKANGCEILEG